LTQEGVIRQDLRPSFGGLTAPADGAQLNLHLTLVGADGCSPLANHAIYLWHCDSGGKYSLYDIVEANFLRGMGVSAAGGVVQFTTIFPGCYDGRWPHIHFEIFTSITAAVSGEAAVLTAQIAMPEAEASTVYATDARYPSGTTNLSRISIATDNVFSDNTADQIAQQTLDLSGSPAGGYTGTLTIPVDFNAERLASMQPPPEGFPKGMGPGQSLQFNPNR
jgi:protocatechuate 3,4-dioxygenase beta subunit